MGLAVDQWEIDARDLRAHPAANASSFLYAGRHTIVGRYAGAAYYTRMTRTAMLETLAEEYVRTARAKGLSGARVVLKHAFRNALRTVVTMAGMDLGAFLGGVLVIEQVFAVPGIGALAWQAILNEDLPMIQGTVLFAACLILVSNLAIDLLYGWIDPRVRTLD